MNKVNAVKRYVVADAAGRILRTVHCTDDQVDGQAGEGEILIQSDDAEPLMHAVDIQTGTVVDAPAAAPRTELAMREEQRRAIQARIVEVEARQARPIRELLLDPDAVEPKRRLLELENQLRLLRAEMHA